MNLQQHMSGLEYLLTLAFGAFIATLVFLIWLEAQPTPAFACPKNLEIIIGNQVLYHKPDSPDTRYCGVAYRP